MRTAGIAAASFLFASATFFGCVPLVSDGADRPSPPGNLTVSASGPSTLPEGATGTFTAQVSQGRAPFQFLWDQNAGPADLELEPTPGASFTSPRFPMPGRYEFRVGVRDADGRTGRAFATVDVSTVLTTDVPDLVLTDQPAPLAIQVSDEAGEFLVAWQVRSGQASIEAPEELNTTLTPVAEETIDLRLTVVAAQPDLEITRDFEIVAVPDLAPRVEVQTRLGNFTIELNARLAPRHAANFLRYVDDGFYDGLLVHRVACQSGSDPCDPFVIQAGGFFRDADGELDRREPTRDPLASEARAELTNETLYSVAMALRNAPGSPETDPDSARTEFFVNLADNGFLDEQGFTAFGQVVEGTEVLDAMTLLQRITGPIIPREVSLPAEDVIMDRVRRVPRP